MHPAFKTSQDRSCMTVVLTSERARARFRCSAHRRLRMLTRCTPHSLLELVAFLLAPFWITSSSRMHCGMLPDAPIARSSGERPRISSHSGCHCSDSSADCSPVVLAYAAAVRALGGKASARSAATSVEPCVAATCSGVRPVMVRAWVFACRLMSECTSSGAPRAAARCSALQPKLFVSARLAPRSCKRGRRL